MGKLKVLVLGDGLLGSEIVKQTEWDYISRKKDGFDITDMETYHLLTNDITDAYYGWPLSDRCDPTCGCVIWRC